MKPVTKPAVMDVSDFDIINGPDDCPSTQHSNGETSTANRRRGTLYIEAQVRPDYSGSLKKLTTKLEDVFRSKCVHAVSLDHEMIGKDLYAECFFPDCLQSLKAVELFGASDDHEYVLVKDYMVEINCYRLKDGKSVETQEALSICGEAILLPSARFDDAWDRLIFDEEIKKQLVVFMTNLMRFSYKPRQSAQSTVNRLVLLSGPPGTGKTSLSIGLAQKLSIRLNKTFGDTILLQLNAATLLSQYFGQSAVKIHSIFEALASQSAETPKTLTILLIDEIESLAASRETASARNEVHDAVRATNALLTGFDMVKNNANVLIVCTSNLSDSLDAAFVDRCSRHIIIPQPALAARYEILRRSINGLIKREIFEGPFVQLPTFKRAEYRGALDYKRDGCALRRLAHKLEATGPTGQVASARWLSHLAEIALANELEPGALCTITDAITLMDRYVETNCGRKPGGPKYGKRYPNELDQERSDTEKEWYNTAKKRKCQPRRGSSHTHAEFYMFGETDPEGMEDVARYELEELREKEGNKIIKPSPAEAERVADMVHKQWASHGGCVCSDTVRQRALDYVEHGIPINRNGFF
ncbi:hypothetical protein V502_03046 [Pseudogymnoascus sp. VKM F-4520 (FW-2644)]|nr:hypothetical protein V502_03046 [Pseudogymnoascus sp. VKM F-4520 (FW-2644)]